MKLPPDLAAMLSAFADEGVRYLIVGGHAVGLHARPRTTKDLDVWLDAAAKNIALACRALRTFGVPSPLVEELRSASPDEIVWLGRPPARIDLLLSIPAVDFQSAWSRRVDVDLDGVQVHVIGRGDLIANKRAVGRPSDKRDVRALEQARAVRKKRP
jgi:predicted nucleotidyltransferase